MQNLEEKIATKASAAVQRPKTSLPIDILEPQVADGDIVDWDGWCDAAHDIVVKLTREERGEWYQLHEGSLDEAELMAPRGALKLLKLFN